MNNKCNTCAKFLTCNKKECKKTTFVQAEILDKPQIIETTTNVNYGITTKEFGEMLQEFAHRLMETKENKKCN